MNLDLALQHHAKAIPNQLAVGWESGTYTYKELNQCVQALANKFHLDGIQAGERIAIILDNCPEFVISYFACMRAGGISVTVNPSLTSRELQIIINDCQPKIIITKKQIHETLQHTQLFNNPQYLLVNGVEVESSFRHYLQNGSDEYFEAVKPEECSIIYTSGTTGIPKGAVLSYHNLYHNAKTFAESFGMTENEKTLIVAPLFHSAAQTNCLNATIYSGGYNYLLPRWTSAVDTLCTMEEQKITFFFGPPTMYTYLLNVPDIKGYKLTLRIAYTGAAPLPEKIFNKWRETFGFEIVEGYGLTETSPVVTFNPPFGRKKLRSIGLPMKDVRVKIVNEEWEEAGVGEPGELVVQGPNVMRGYWNRSEETNAVFVDGWFKTGDIAKKDSDGYLYIVDRKKDMIIRSGFNVYPREIEEVLYQHPFILEAAVIGYPDEAKGEVALAVVTLKDGKILNKNIDWELKQFCKEHLAGYKVPSKIIIVNELPKTTSGKIIKGELRELYISQ